MVLLPMICSCMMTSSYVKVIPVMSVSTHIVIREWLDEHLLNSWRLCHCSLVKNHNSWFPRNGDINVTDAQSHEVGPFWRHYLWFSWCNGDVITLLPHWLLITLLLYHCYVCLHDVISRGDMITRDVHMYLVQWFDWCRV